MIGLGEFTEYCAGHLVIGYAANYRLILFAEWTQARKFEVRRPAQMPGVQPSGEMGGINRPWPLDLGDETVSSKHKSQILRVLLTPAQEARERSFKTLVVWR